MRVRTSKPPPRVVAGSCDPAGHPLNDGAHPHPTSNAVEPTSFSSVTNHETPSRFEDAKNLLKPLLLVLEIPKRKEAKHAIKGRIGQRNELCKGLNIGRWGLVICEARCIHPLSSHAKHLWRWVQAGQFNTTDRFRERTRPAPHLEHGHARLGVGRDSGTPATVLTKGHEAVHAVVMRDCGLEFGLEHRPCLEVNPRRVVAPRGGARGHALRRPSPPLDASLGACIAKRCAPRFLA